MTFQVFDAPLVAGPFEARLRYLQRALKGQSRGVALPQLRCAGDADLARRLAVVLEAGGEGLMLRSPGSPYVTARSRFLLKVKATQSDEARVVGHQPGTGRHAGRLGALLLRTPHGVSFKVGTGLSDAEREKPPKLGALVSYGYQELTRDGVPRFPVYLATRDYE